MLRPSFSLPPRRYEQLKIYLCRFGPYLTLSVSYGPNQGFELAVPGDTFFKWNKIKIMIFAVLPEPRLIFLLIIIFLICNKIVSVTLAHKLRLVLTAP